MINAKNPKGRQCCRGGKSQGGSVFLVNGICPSLLSGMSHGNVMPYVVEVKELKSEIKDNRSNG